MSPAKVQVELEVDLPNDFSDGDPGTWPDAPYKHADETNYRAALAKQWFEEQGLGFRCK